MSVVDPIVLSADVDGARARLALEVPRDLDYFDGHFPGAPVLPGVVQIKWALDLARRYLGVGGAFAGAEALKFQHVLVPGAHARLELEHVAASGKLRFAFRDDARLYGSGRLLLRPLQ